MNTGQENRIYNINECIVFAKTNEPFGGLSNMAAGYPLFINDNIIPNSEALYQAMRYSLFPKIQYEIISQHSPMTAKMISKKYRAYSRQDWESVRIKIMRWALEIKLSQHWITFSELLKATEDKPIVEYSRKDNFWGATKINDNQLSGVNALGRLLMDLREKHARTDTKIDCVNPVNIAGFRLYDHDIDLVCDENYFLNNRDEEYSMEFA